MKRSTFIILIFSLALLVIPGPLAQAATPVADGGIIQGTITATGRYIFNWLDDDLCALSFWDYDFTPSIVVSDESGAEVATLEVSKLPGSVTMEGPAGDQHAEICTVPYEINLASIPDRFRVTLDPYFRSELMTLQDLEHFGGTLDISVERKASDPGPDFRHRSGGLIIGTDRYRIQGILEVPTDAATSPVMATSFGCVTTGGYRDIAVGTQLTVTNEVHEIIAVTTLEPLYVPNDELCAFLFTAEVPEATFYTIELRRRGSLTYSKDDLEKREWNIELTIGA